MLTFLLWCILLIFCWPLALVFLVLYPIVWLVLLPFRILGIAVEGVLELLKAVIFFTGSNPTRAATRVVILPASNKANDHLRKRLSRFV